MWVVVEHDRTQRHNRREKASSGREGASARPYIGGAAFGARPQGSSAINDLSWSSEGRQGTPPKLRGRRDVVPHLRLAQAHRIQRGIDPVRQAQHGLGPGGRLPTLISPISEGSRY